MINLLFKNGSKILTQKQKSIFSAAVLIMIMISLSRILGLVRNRVLAHFFPAETLSIYFAAFRLPETIFEILIFGTLSSAFIPVFTSYISKKREEEAWYVVSSVINLTLVFFLILAIFIFVFAQPIYRLIAPGFSSEDVLKIANLSRILLLAQAFFILSYFLTAVLESFQRFLIPALSPLFYNLGIIVFTILAAEKWGIYAPVLGATVGAFFHFIIQLPLAFYLGFRPKVVFNLNHPGVRKIGKLALPRIVELAFLQINKGVELFLASLVSLPAYTYYTFANSLQLLPVSLFGTSIAKASLPSLSYYSVEKNYQKFKESFLFLFRQIVFLTFPLSVFLIILRIPLVRLAFGAARFDWSSTIQTGLALSAFCLSITPQALIYLLNRSFYALHDTKLPVKVSLFSMFLDVFLGVVSILFLKLPIWSLALAFSLSSLIQMLLLIFFLKKKINFSYKPLLVFFLKIGISTFFSALVMFFFLKVLDRSAWDKRLSFLGWFGLALPVSFDRFVLDTRYTINVIWLTLIVGLLGLLIYFLLCWVLGIKEIKILERFLFSFKKPKEIPPPITIDAGSSN